MKSFLRSNVKITIAGILKEVSMLALTVYGLSLNFCRRVVITRQSTGGRLGSSSMRCLLATHHSLIATPLASMRRSFWIRWGNLTVLMLSCSWCLVFSMHHHQYQHHHHHQHLHHLHHQRYYHHRPQSFTQVVWPRNPVDPLARNLVTRLLVLVMIILILMMMNNGDNDE